MVPKWLLGNLVAHRGLHNAEYSENTLEAFKNAADHHYNIEMDVQLTKDGKPVVYHDLRLDRLTDHDCLVKELTLNEVRKVRYLQGGSIPTLEEALEVCEGRCGIMLEVKKDSYDAQEIDIEKVIYPILKSYRGDFVVKSFDPYTVKWFADNAPEFSRGLLCEYEQVSEYPPSDRALVRELLDPDKPLVDFFDYHVGKVGSEIWNEATKHLPAVVWTVRSQEQYEAVRSKVINVIFENFIPEVKKA